MTVHLGSFYGDVRATVLTGLTTVTTAVVAVTDTVMGAVQKLQAQVSYLNGSVASIATVSVTNANVTLTAAQASAPVIMVSGAMTASARIVWPLGYMGRRTVYNTCTNSVPTGSFYLQTGTPSGTGPNVYSGQSHGIWLDGTYVYEDTNDLVNLSVNNLATMPTTVVSDSSNSAATTSYVNAKLNGGASISVAGGVTVTLTAAQSASQIIVFTGALTASIAVVFPTTVARWLVANYTTGAFTLMCKTAAGTGVAVTQGTATTRGIWCDGTNIWGMT